MKLNCIRNDRRPISTAKANAGFFEPNRIAIQTESGRVVDSRDDPRSAFRGHTRQTPWDDLHLAYFSGYALWNYLTVPFFRTYPGFVTEELAP